jgi:hypothetical protein
MSLYCYARTNCWKQDEPDVGCSEGMRQHATSAFGAHDRMGGGGGGGGDAEHMGEGEGVYTGCLPGSTRGLGGRGQDIGKKMGKGWGGGGGGVK